MSENSRNFSLTRLIVVIIWHVGLVAEFGELCGGFQEVVVSVDGVCYREAPCPVRLWEQSLDSLNVGEIIVVHVVDITVD